MRNSVLPGRWKRAEGEGGCLDRGRQWIPSAPAEDPVDGLNMALSIISSVIFSEMESKLEGLGSGGSMAKSSSAGAREIRGSLLIEAS